MKRYVTFIILIFLAISGNAQCNLNVEKDLFTRAEKRSTDYEQVGAVGKNGLLKFRIIEYIDKDTTTRLYIYINRLSIRCVGNDSRLLIRAGDEVITLKFSGMDQCGVHLEDYAVLTPEDIKILKQNKMAGIRVHYINGYDDFDIEFSDKNDDLFYENKSEYFIRTLKCFEKKRSKQ